MKKAAKEIKGCKWYDYIIINDDLEKAIREAHAIIISEQCKTTRRMQSVKEIFDSLF
jgi:guanylate kinase